MHKTICGLKVIVKRLYVIEGIIMSEKVYSIEEITQIILPLIKKYRASKVILFGSYARNEADKDSDIDVLVIGGDAFDPTDVFCIADELNRLSQKKVDVYEEREINHTSAFYNTIISEGVEIA